ncbi:NADPH-dependent glutamate synthase beta chain or related oxidoreductase [endosymbiont of Ridgeia piscesae]|jgi:glutamate synthase (NADPH/NADH) small chain|uniref:NADPH-dependent glutamate synthase beta chain or related oxidoreductase n=2 Tax=endosymbiont of Ridgeia piscesae TaxID=54398 RepID=A0A0T5YZT9_9GAMM|nr:FAD-dependent oxidoreductase [endosymbiont of Ridgeia piscesae]KRT55701.1 NADPH-dependent glutamate synthase beta chain or related oxidoreductase [endosymbiont of Ridgeia piscesae]
MSDIDYKDKGSILNPLKSLQFFARKPVTESLEPRPAAENYRGFHLNDHNKCIGCSSCQKVCDNAAITMVKVPHLREDPVQGIRNLRPAIDYGRCCWCALCVDICPTGAITLSREYVHTCTQAQIDSYFILPNETGIHGEFHGQGWTKTADSDLLDLERQPMAELEPEQRIDNFDEIVAGFTLQQAVLEASRCVQCGMCHDACPTHMDAPEYIRAIWQEDLEGAVRWIYRSNPFSHVCGRVCTRRCESACSIGRRGDPVAIRWLKRYAMDAVGHARVKAIAAEGKADYLTGHRIAIIGAGPAGLTAAYDLACKGHEVTVFEAREKPGGMTRYGIPEYRLPYDMLDRDIDVITSLGVKIECNTQVGVDISMPQLQRGYDAVALAIGLHLGRSTRIPGSDHAQVKKAVELLRAITDEQPFELPRQAVVIGGGNVAMDIARSLARLQKQQFGEVQVTVTALEDQAHFLADPVEIKECHEEGVEILDARGPQEFVVEEDKLKGLKSWRVRSIFDEQGRFAPSYDESDEQLHPGEMVVEAIGQMADVSLLGDALTEQLAWNRGRIQVDENGRTSVDGFWAAGDCVNGPDVVHAVADGLRIAASIDGWLNLKERADHE